MGNFKIMGCPHCGSNKTGSTHTYGTYRCYIHNTTIKLSCKTCRHTEKYRFIIGGATNE